MEEWSTQRWGDAQVHVGEDFSREEFLEEGYVAESRGGAREGDAHHVMNMRTPSPGADASSRTPSPGARPPVPDRGSILGAYRDTPVEWINRSVKPSGCYIVIDGVSGGRYEPAQTFQEWYGFYGAEHYIGVGTTARSFAWITGDDEPQHRAEDMRIALLRQSESRGTPAHEAVREQYDLWGNQEPASLLREPNDSADTEYHSDLFVTARMADRWLKIQQLQSDKICWDATYGPDTQGSSHLSKDCDGKPWKEWMGEEPIGHPSNAAREKAWRKLERDFAIPDYASIVGATVSHHMSTAAGIIMAHLTTCIFVGHANRKTEQDSVGQNSPLADKVRADDNVRRLDDQIRMIQYVRSRIGEDRDTILDMGRIPDYATRFPAPLTPFQVGDTSERGQVPYGSATAGGGFKPIVPIVSEGDDPGKQASKRSPEYSPVTDDDERPELKRSKQCKGVTTVIIINSGSVTPPPGASAAIAPNAPDLSTDIKSLNDEPGLKGGYANGRKGREIDQIGIIVDMRSIPDSGFRPPRTPPAMAAEVKAEDQVLANAAAELTTNEIDERQRLMLQRNEGFRYSDESREVFNLRVRLGQPPTEGEITTELRRLECLRST